MKLLVLADDLTGSLDTGIQFVAGHAKTCVVLNADYPLHKVDPSVQVLVIDTESRHLPPKQAAEIVQNIVRQAVALQVPYLYKKTDSALRGNVGAELEAALKASGAKQLHFIPAFPRVHRSTENGVQLIDGVPVAESVFGKDPFDPVRYYKVAEFLNSQAEVSVANVPIGAPPSDEPGVVVYDAVTAEDIRTHAKHLNETGKLHIMAGCAGFAAALPEFIPLSGALDAEPQYNGAFLAVCGSVNPITVAQMDEAEQNGFDRIRITAQQALTPGFFASTEGLALLDSWADRLNKGVPGILDSNPAPGAQTAYEYAELHGLSREELRVTISDAMGTVLAGLLQRGVNATMLITGGDTLMGFMRTVGVAEIVPVRELMTGTVLSSVEIGGKTYNMISKSGGFGEKTLVTDLAKLVTQQK